jgi:hypothetical protein
MRRSTPAYRPIRQRASTNSLRRLVRILDIRKRTTDHCEAPPRFLGRLRNLKWPRLQPAWWCTFRFLKPAHFSVPVDRHIEAPAATPRKAIAATLATVRPNEISHQSPGHTCLRGGNPAKLDIAPSRCSATNRTTPEQREGSSVAHSVTGTRKSPLTRPNRAPDHNSR